MLGFPISQKSIDRVDNMPAIPQPYKMLDWRQKALDYDSYVFDWDARDDVRPLIWLDNSKRNGDQEAFGLKTTVGDNRSGPDHEAINTMAAVMGAGLVGIDKVSGDGHNYPKMLQKYFASDERWNIMLNNTAGTATDWWYNVLPNLLYWGVCDIFPGVEGADQIQKTIANQFATADETLGDNYSYSFFNYYSMHGFSNKIPKQEDAAAGHAYVLLQAWRKFGDQRYLDRAINAMNVLNAQPQSRFYEILMPFGAYCAAWLNTYKGTEYDLGKIISWSFDGSRGRWGWGVICDRWGDYDVYGLQGSITDGGGYAFQMNCYEMAWPLVPMVKYAPEYATMIGKWMLNNANASRLFFPLEIDDAHQACPELKDITGNIIGYEGLRKTDRYGKVGGVPVAEGDGPSWSASNPQSTMFSLYSTSPVGIFGSIISTTDVECILSLDCNATDFYADRRYPCHLMYNPYEEDKVVTYTCSAACDLFDAVGCDFVSKNVSGTIQVTVPAQGSVLLYELPKGTTLYYIGTKIGTRDGLILTH
ncbi:MAG: hypothetical protein IKN31_07080 [Bacteroidales bacterium]|nr:hypothetical protein [Bacteroidales bacterium]